MDPSKDFSFHLLKNIFAIFDVFWRGARAVKKN